MNLKGSALAAVWTALLLTLSTFAFADPIDVIVEPTSNGSSVETTILASNCLLPCYVDTEISSDLDAIWSALGVGGSWTFDFFDITVTGLGAAIASIDATLAFIQPDIFAASSNGDLGFFTFLGWISGGVLLWDQPELVYLTDGTALNIMFEEIADIGFGNSTTVSATVSRHPVLEPNSLFLLAGGLLLLGMFRFRGRRRQTH